jgi:hypothetical protein
MLLVIFGHISIGKEHKDKTMRERLEKPKEKKPFDVKQVIDNVIVLDVVFHRAGIRRKADISKIDAKVTDEELATDKAMLGLTKSIVDSKEYTAAVKVTSDARAWLDRRSLPSPLKRGTYLVPLSMVDDVNVYLDEVDKQYRAKVEEFLLVYPQQVENAKVRLANQFDQRNYPTIECLRASFWIERRMLDFGVPSPAKIGQELWQKEKARAEQSWSTAVDEIQIALREAFRTLVAHLAERLEPNPDGTKKIFKDTAIEKLVEFIDIFKNRNLTGDAELEGLVSQARNVLSGKRPESLRKNSSARGEVAGEMARVTVALDKLLVNASKRSIRFEDD